MSKKKKHELYNMWISGTTHFVGMVSFIAASEYYSLWKFIFILAVIIIILDSIDAWAPTPFTPTNPNLSNTNMNTYWDFGVNKIVGKILEKFKVR